MMLKVASTHRTAACVEVSPSIASRAFLIGRGALYIPAKGRHSRAVLSIRCFRLDEVRCVV